MAAAEAEIRRRPAPELRHRRIEPRPRATLGPSRAELLKAMEETRRELRHTAQRLTRLGKRLDSLEQMALQSTPSRDAERRASDDLLFDDEAA